MTFIRPKDGPRCPECPLFERGKVVIDRDIASDEVKLVLMGEAPGREETRDGVCFVGKSGQMLDHLFDQLEIPKPYISNSVRCGLAGGAKPKPKDLKLASECCRAITDELLDYLRPNVVMALGNTALEHLVGLTGIEKYRGCCWESFIEKRETQKFIESGVPKVFEVENVVDRHDYVATCSIHPAGLLHQEERRIWIELLRDDISKAWQLATGKINLWLPEVGHAANVNELLDFLDDCWSAHEMGVDVETTGLDALTCALRTIGVGTEHKAYSIPWPEYFPLYWRPEDWRRVQEKLSAIFADEEMHLVFSNKIFDVSVLRQPRYFADDIRAICDDALLRHHAVYPKLPHDLQSMASQQLPIPPWKTEFDDTFGDWKSEDDRDDEVKAGALFFYNAMDVATTVAVNNRLKSQVVANGVEKVYDCDRRLVDIAIDFYRRGILIDMDEVHRLAALYRSGDPDNPGILDKLDALIQGYAIEAGLTNFNPKSNPQLSELLFKRLGLPAHVLTETGQLSTSKETLYKIFHKHPIIPAMMKFRKEQSLYSTYLVGLERKLHGDGRLHSVGNITSTPSGRFGFSPAVQNWPKGKKPGEVNMLKMMVATPGTKYVNADFSALELRFFALLAGERRLIEMFNDGVDVHLVHAEKFFGDSFRNADEAGKKILRTRSKPPTFCKNYGGGADAMFNQVLPDRLDEDPDEVFREVKYISETFDGLYPMLVAAGDYFVNLAKEDNNLRTMLTRRMRKFFMGGASLTIAKNHPVQGGAGDVMNLATLRWLDDLKASGAYWTTVFPTLQVHDSLSSEVLEEHAEEEADRLKRMLYTELTYTSPISKTTNSMKFPAEVTIGNTVAD